MFKKYVTAAVIAASTVASGAIAQDKTTAWKKVGDWEIVVDSVSQGCTMQKQFDNGILLQFGLLPKRDAGFFAVYRQDWVDVKNGVPVTVEFAFDGVPYKGTAQGYITKPWYGGFAEVNDPEVVYDFAKKYVMTVKGPNNTFELSLDGTLKGVEALEECQKSIIQG